MTLHLRPWRTEDVPELVRLANNRRVAEQLRDAFPHPYTTEAGQTWVAFAKLLSPATHLAIECDDTLIGSVGYLPGKDVERVSAEVGYWIGEPYWGRGLATAALLELVQLVVARGRFARLFALPFANNMASRRVLEKAGFTLDAVLHRSAIKGGCIVDQCLYSLVLPE